MKTKFISLLLTGFLIGGCASSESNSIKSHVQKSLVCYQLYKTAAAALKHKASGGTKEELIAPLPSRSALNNYPKTMAPQKILGLAMLDIADEVYTYELLDRRVYSSYTAELCHRKLKGETVPDRFSSIYIELKNCATLPESEKILCGMGVSGSKLSK